MTELLGTMVGSIRVEGHLGKGGMGDVYVGFDEKLERPVALKAIRLRHRLDARAKARFLSEARILSQLDDPSICRIYDYIEGDKNDYLVLELIEGKNLRQVFDQGTDPALRMKVAERVAEALVTAHAKGIIHRDLKPDNVMLTPEGEVKVLDFGLAQSLAKQSLSKQSEPLAAIQSTEAESTEADETGETDTDTSSVVGTPMYMSPEHARGERVNSASDMYSFGLLLQELFTGEPPQPKLPLQLILFRVLEGKTKPVTGVDRDLAALINRLKSLAAAARPTAVETLERLRWIRDKPKRLLRRALTVLALLVVAAGAAKYTLDLRRERTLALEARDEAEEVVSFLVDLFEVADPAEALGKTITAQQILDQGAEKVHQDLADQPLIQARLLTTIGTVYRKIGLYDEAVYLLEEGLDLRTRLLPENHPELAQSLHDLAGVYIQRGWFDEAEPLLRRALAIREEVFGLDHLEVAESLNSLGNLFLDQERFADAEPLFRRALVIREQALGGEHFEVARSLNNLALIATGSGREAEAESLYQRTLAIKEKTLEPDHPSLARSLNNLAYLYLRQAKYTEAKPLFERALAIWEKTLGPDHLALAWPLQGLAILAREEGRYQDAKPLLKRALKIREDLPADHPELLDTLRELTLTEGLGSD